MGDYNWTRGIRCKVCFCDVYRPGLDSDYICAICYQGYSGKEVFGNIEII